ncbi:DNA starvation/stationary phase protection protein [Pelagibaculum spongiae]|uniref:DNA starvation/stationary phase protection protein n=2 Tax=Pelagibaculum spongiae TaxID=2080658 RepID=A0A2V1H3Z7_9GAMM|nr:DNA starvation/stationary phase protection protein [Pelagibaculum spongiae]
MSLSIIGLDQKKSETIAKDLNELLANYQIFYMNVRGYHWNIKGEKFFELHLKFEELYNDLLLKVDEVAERILTLGYQPEHAYSVYTQHSEITEKLNITDGKQAVGDIVASLALLIKKQRAILSLAADAEDEGSSSLMSDYIKEQEKLIWMYSAFLA